MQNINPYLTFNGNCADAFAHYKSVFGGEYTSISRFKDMPADAGMTVSGEDAERILHVSLPIGTGNMLMGSDTPSSTNVVTVGNNVSVSVHPESEEEAERIFAALAAGGIVTMPLGKTFWNAYFGMCTDQFGVNWMVNYDYGPQ